MPALADLELLCQSGRGFIRQWRWSDAVAAGQQVVESVDTAVLDPHHRDSMLLAGLSIWGEALRRQNRLLDSALRLRRALHIASAYPAEPLRLASACNDLGILCQTSGQFLQAEQFFRRGLAAASRSAAPEGAIAATLHRGLAGLEHVRQNYQRGLKLARKACLIRSRLTGQDGLEAVADNIMLATLHDALRQYAASRPIYLDAIVALQRIHGPEHCEVALCLGRLAAIAWVQGRPAEAVADYRQAVEMLQRTLGPVHVETIAMARNLMTVERECGRTVRALEKVTACYGCYEGRVDCCRS